MPPPVGGSTRFQRHAEIVVSLLELEGAKVAVTPGVDDPKETAAEEQQGSEPLPPQQATLYRAVAARGKFLAQDRSDVQYSVKETCRSMSSPDHRSWNRLKRLGRYLLGRPRAVAHFPWHETEDTCDVYSDSNWAGCHPSRKSRSGGAIMYGPCCIKSWSKMHNTVAQSSAEAELIATVKGATEAIGVLSLAKDLGIEFSIRMHIDASAALGIVERRGVGRVRHLDVGMLWLQEQQLRQVIATQKILGTENPADLMTKCLSREAIDKFSSKLGFEFRDGRAHSTAKVHNLTKIAAPSFSSICSAEHFYTDRGSESSDEERRSVVCSPFNQKPKSKSAIEETGEARTWKCLTERHWQSVVRGARSYRSPSCAGISWTEIERHVTYELPDMVVMQDVRPRKEGCTEKEVCQGFGRAADTLTDAL